MSSRGIHIWIHWTFLLLAGWVILATIRYATDVRQVAWAVFFILAAVICVALHELGHAFVASLYGIRAKEIILLPVGGIASIEKFPDNPAQELAISIAGPLINVLIALLLWRVTLPHASFWAVPDDLNELPGRGLLYILQMGNIGLAAFNLIPAFPMDGGRILRALLGFRFNYIRATTIAGIIGKIVATIFVGLGVVTFSPLVAIIGIFIFLSAGTEEYYLRLRSLAKGVKLNEVLMYDFTSLQADMKVQEAAQLLINNHNNYFILMDGEWPAGALNRLEIVKAIAEMKYSQPLRSLVKEQLEYLDASGEVDAVLEKLARDKDQVFPVMDQGRFAGVVNLNYIIEYLLLHNSGGKEYGRLKSLAGLMR
jgi:Zn-dependent protease